MEKESEEKNKRNPVRTVILSEQACRSFKAIRVRLTMRQVLHKTSLHSKNKKPAVTLHSGLFVKEMYFLGAEERQNGLALGELEALAGPRLTRLLTFLHSRITP